MYYKQGSFIQKYKWKKRLLLLFAPNNNHSELRKQLLEIERFAGGFEERDLKVFTCTSNSEMVSQLRNRYQVELDLFTCVFIGKNGVEKMRQNQVLLSDDLFRFIDDMPMRQWEMKVS